MATFYRVIQYLPDPTNDERINIGVVAYGEGQARTCFLRDWRRVRAFGREDIGFLKDFVREVEGTVPEQMQIPGVSWAKGFDEDFLKSEADRWINSIQFSEPRASILKTEELLDAVARRFLHNYEARRRDYRDRSDAKRMAYRQISSVLKGKGEDLPKKLLQKECIVPGKYDIHQFDVGARNGHLIFAAHALSFEVQETRDFVQEYESIAYHITDVRSADKDLPLAIVSYPPKGVSKVFEKAARLFGALNVPILNEHNIGDWTLEKVGPYLVA